MIDAITLFDYRKCSKFSEAWLPFQPLLHHFQRHSRNVRRDELSCRGERRGEIHKIPTLISRAKGRRRSRSCLVHGGSRTGTCLIEKSGKCQEGWGRARKGIGASCSGKRISDRSRWINSLSLSLLDIRFLFVPSSIGHGIYVWE